LGVDVPVKNVKIFNRGGDESRRLSWAKVSIIDNAGKYLETYQIYDASGITLFDIPFGLNEGATAVVAWKGPSRKIRVDLGKKEYLHMREVQVLDYNNVNRALGKTATHSPVYPNLPASNAVDGNLDTISHTDNTIGKYNHISSLKISYVSCTISF
jgi:hypothetical protein